MRLRSISIMAALLSATSLSTAFAQTADSTPAATAPSPALQEIVVTASRRSENLQSTPISVSALSGAGLAQESRTQVDEVLQGVPGVKVQALSQGFAVAVRGVGVETTPGIGDPAVASNYDGIYSDRIESGRIGFYDINRVEVLRGPQGTLYGRNSAGGVVNVISNDPKLGAYDASAQIGAGNYAALNSQGEVNVPIGDTLALRAAFETSKHDGYYSNGQSDTDDLGARIKLLWAPAPVFKVLFGAQYGHVTSNGTGNTPGFIESHSNSVYDTDGLTPNAYDFIDRKVWLRADLDLGFGVLTVIPSYQDLNSYSVNNIGAFNIVYAERERQTSVEARIAAEPTSLIKWTAGFYYYTSTHSIDTTSPGDQLEVFDATSYAGFAEATIPFADNRIRLTGGVRETVDEKSDSITDIVPGATTSAALNKDFYHFDYKVNLQGDLTPHSMVYANISTGYRPGGIYETGAGDTFKTETITAYELGSKNRFLDNRLQINGDAYYYNYANFQATNTIFINGNPVQAVYNAPSVTSYGAELEATYLITPLDQFTVSEALLHARFNSGFTLAGIDYSGRPTGHAPSSQTRISYTHTFDLGEYGRLSAEADSSYETSSYVTFAEVAYGQQRPYTLSNALLTYQPRHNWTLSAYIKNIEDVAVKGQALVQGPTTDLVLLAPRTYGFNIGYKF